MSIEPGQPLSYFNNMIREKEASMAEVLESLCQMSTLRPLMDVADPVDIYIKYPGLALSLYTMPNAANMLKI